MRRTHERHHATYTTGHRLTGLAGLLLYGNVREMRSVVASVGLIVLVGCFTLVIAPDEPLETAGPGKGLPTVVIDAGHGGNDGGAQRGDALEKRLTLQLALRLEAVLHERGFPTVMTRSADRYVSLKDRVLAANAVEGPSLFLSLHFNRGSASYINGIETYYAKAKVPPPKGWQWVGFFNPPEEEPDNGEKLAAQVQQAMIARTGAKDRGIRPSRFFVVRHTRAPAILIEGGFLTNPMESTLVGNPSYRNRLAEAIADGVDTWWQTQPMSPPSPHQPLARAGQ